jgi:hypothetical protein
MKKVFLLSVCTLSFTALAVTAQTKKMVVGAQSQTNSNTLAANNYENAVRQGRWVLGLTGEYFANTYNINTPSESSSNATTFYPDVAYFIKDRLAVGLRLQFLNQTNKNAANDKDVITIMGLAPTVQYYVPISNRFMFMGGLQVAYKVKKDVSNGVSNTPIKSITASAFPSFVFFASPKISFQTQFASLSYTTSKADYKGHSFDFSVLNQLNLGLNIHLGK